MMLETVLQDRRVLVVEDEYMIADAMGRELRRAGAMVLGPVSNVAAALALLETEEEIDAAVLDINLGEQKVYPVVDALLARGAECVFATGNDAADVPLAYASLTRCEKPVDTRCLIQALTASGVASAQKRDDARIVALTTLREQLLQQMQVADGAGETLLSVRLSEAFDVADRIVKSCV